MVTLRLLISRSKVGILLRSKRIVVDSRDFWDCVENVFRSQLDTYDVFQIYLFTVLYIAMI